MGSDDIHQGPRGQLGRGGNEPVGTATVMEMPNLTYGCAPAVFIEAVVVAYDHRRLGVATAILTLVLDDARARGCDKVQL